MCAYERRVKLFTVQKVKNLRVCNKEGETLATTGSTYYTIRALESVRVYPSSIFEKKNAT